MNEMIERVARAISDERQKHRYGSVMTPWGDAAMAESFRREQIELARAAIGAMREPTREMTNAAWVKLGDGFSTDVWRVMIDWILNEDGK